jgi:uncharacterized protein (TIGR01777 family)
MSDPAQPQRVAITGASGLVGGALQHAVLGRGGQVVALVRRPPRHPRTEAQWDPERGLVSPEQLGTIDAVVHLAGENIAGGRWTDSMKRRIRDSRVIGTDRLCQSLAALPVKPRVLVSASAIGYYGDRGDEVLSEASPPGEGYLPEVCVGWEQATQPARDAGIRVVNLRIGIILSPDGGALHQMLLPFKLGLGGKVGSGRQFYSWVSLDDVVGAMLHAIDHAELSGPVNATSPQPVTNAELTKTLGSVLNRPTIVPMPAFAARLALGEMADGLLLASARVLPRELERTGYTFRHPGLRQCLEAALGRG